MMRRSKVKSGTAAPTQRKGHTDETASAKMKSGGRFKSLFGFHPKDITSWSSIVRLVNEPRDPTGIAVIRILFGFLMMIDITQERGMAHLDNRFGHPNHCQFPLFNGLVPLSVDWMYILYLVMLSGAMGICLGFFYRLSCTMYFIPYWYVFLLDKSSWNNHSYLYGLLGFQLTWMDANRCWSVDSFLDKKIKNKHVPLWNYAMLRSQIFIVYFIAGLKKLDMDWLYGYSMTHLSRSWVFDPFKYILAEDQIDFFIVHLGGLCLDLFGGWLLFFDRTRPLGFFFLGSFHTMNSQLFSIGMFPYCMLATLPVFCYADWPKSLLTRCPLAIQKRLLPEDAANDGMMPQSEHCIYPIVDKDDGCTGGVQDIDIKNESKKSTDKGATKATRHHHIASCWLILYLSWQLFMPYSHFITKGYNHWTNGLYGYSWDMMIQSWDTQHIKVKFVEKGTGEEGYLSPEYFSPDHRWTHHADMIKQYSQCVSDHLQNAGYNEVEVYLDIWKSMNGRFQQRMWNPLENMARAEWSPFKTPPWTMPLLTELSDWRNRLQEIEDELGEEVGVTFVADFPGLFLENYLSEDFGNTSLTVLSGKVKVELLENGTNIVVREGEQLQLPVDAFHNVHTISTQPSTYMYLFVNNTAVEFEKNITEALEKGGSSIDELRKGAVTNDTIANITDPELAGSIREMNERWSRHQTERQSFITNKVNLYSTIWLKTTLALKHILFGHKPVLEAMKALETPGPEHIMPQHSHTSMEL